MRSLEQYMVQESEFQNKLPPKKQDLVSGYLENSLRLAIGKHMQNLAEEFSDCLVNFEVMEKLISENEEDFKSKQHEIFELSKVFERVIAELEQGLEQKLDQLLARRAGGVEYNCN